MIVTEMYVLVWVCGRGYLLWDPAAHLSGGGGAEKGVGSSTIGLSTWTIRSSFLFNDVRQCWTLAPLALHSQPPKLLGYLQACNQTNKTRTRRFPLCYPCMHRKLSPTD